MFRRIQRLVGNILNRRISLTAGVGDSINDAPMPPYANVISTSEPTGGKQVYECVEEVVFFAVAVDLGRARHLDRKICVGSTSAGVADMANAELLPEEMRNGFATLATTMPIGGRVGIDFFAVSQAIDNATRSELGVGLCSDVAYCPRSSRKHTSMINATSTLRRGNKSRNSAGIRAQDSFKEDYEYSSRWVKTPKAQRRDGSYFHSHPRGNYNYTDHFVGNPAASGRVPMIDTDADRGGAHGEPDTECSGFDWSLGPSYETCEWWCNSVRVT
jgi:hypothetical protein